MREGNPAAWLARPLPLSGLFAHPQPGGGTLGVTTSTAPTAAGRRSTFWQDPLPACSPGRPCRAPYRVRRARTTTSRCLGRALGRAGTAPPLRRVGRPALARLRATAAQG